MFYLLRYNFRLILRHQLSYCPENCQGNPRSPRCRRCRSASAPVCPFAGRIAGRRTEMTMPSQSLTSLDTAKSGAGAACAGSSAGSDIARMPSLPIGRGGLRSESWRNGTIVNCATSASPAPASRRRSAVPSIRGWGGSMISASVAAVKPWPDGATPHQDPTHRRIDHPECAALTSGQGCGARAAG